MKSVKIIERMLIYKDTLSKQIENGKKQIFSHELAESASSSSSLVRRDLMALGYSGNQKKGYNIEELKKKIDSLLSGKTINIALVGVGNLGKAILRYYSNLYPRYVISACFDIDKEKIGQFIFHSKCYNLDDLKNIVSEKDISVGIITVPAESAQQIADKLIEAGIKGIINFAPIRIKTPKDVFVEHIDFSNVVEKVFYFSKLSKSNK